MILFLEQLRTYLLVQKLAASALTTITCARTSTWANVCYFNCSMNGPSRSHSLNFYTLFYSLYVAGPKQAADGECTDPTTKAFMEVNCRRSCKLCRCVHSNYFSKVHAHSVV
jgi:hypothetical protein